MAGPEGRHLTPTTSRTLPRALDLGGWMWPLPGEEGAGKHSNFTLAPESASKIVRAGAASQTRLFPSRSLPEDPRAPARRAPSAGTAPRSSLRSPSGWVRARRPTRARTASPELRVGRRDRRRSGRPASPQTRFGKKTSRGRNEPPLSLAVLPSRPAENVSFIMTGRGGERVE